MPRIGETVTSGRYSAKLSSVGTGKQIWFAYVDGVMVRDKIGVGRRFKSAEAAISAAKSVAPAVVAKASSLPAPLIPTVVKKSTANEKLFNQVVRHRVALEKYSNATLREVLKELRGIENDVVRRIGINVATSRDTSQLDAFLHELRDLYRDTYATMTSRLAGNLDDLAVYESQWQARSISIASGFPTTAPSVPSVIAAVNAKPFEGKLLSSWMEDLPKTSVAKVEAAVKQGFVEGQSIQAIVSRVRGTRAAGFSDGILDINRRSAEALVRTAVAHVASVAQEETYDANRDIISGVEWVSVLDSRTTPICRARDGNIYKIGKGPRPPAHINCRSTTISHIRGVTAPPRKTYAQWLKEQDADDLADILGPSRAALYTAGKLPIERFVNNRGDLLTLSQLKKQEARAFKRAGL